MLRILHVVASLGSGGIESLLYNYYLKMDRDNVQFDFIVHGEYQGIFESKFLELGSNIYHVRNRKKTFLGNIKDIKKIIYSNNYDVVHSHIEHMSFIPLYYAKKFKIEKRIAHTHLSYQDNKFNKSIKKVLNFFVKRYANSFFGCSMDAIYSSYGKSFKDGKLLKNAIDRTRFSFNMDDRLLVRANHGILENEILLGNVGRFTDQKNHLFLIEIFRAICEDKNNYKLLLIGEGPLLNDVKRRINEYNLQEKIIFVNPTHEISKYMSAFDIFLFPSKYEGLGIVLIEAQAMLLPVIASAKVIPLETKISNFIEYLNIDESEYVWANKVMALTINNNRNFSNEFVTTFGYDVSVEIDKLMKEYLRTNENKNN